MESSLHSVAGQDFPDNLFTQFPRSTLYKPYAFSNVILGA